MLELEVAGEVIEVKEGEAVPTAKPPMLRTLRDSHHSVARLLARGLTPAQVSLQTGYALSRISSLQNDTAFRDLLAHYRRENQEILTIVEERYLLVANDAAQAVHEKLLDNPDEVPLSQALEVFKAFADRAGYAPVQRSVNKNVNLNIGERLDAARARQSKLVEHE